MTKKTLFLHYKKSYNAFFIISTFFLLSINDLNASILWNSTGKESTVQVKNETIRDVLNYAEKNSNYLFIYSEDLHDILDKKVSISLSNKKNQ